MRIRMGWFWILDGLNCNFLRRQKLVAHSNLPESEMTYLDGDLIMEALKEKGVFDENFSGSSDLADITISKHVIPGHGFESSFSCGSEYDVTYIYARFTSLFIHW